MFLLAKQHAERVVDELSTNSLNRNSEAIKEQPFDYMLPNNYVLENDSKPLIEQGASNETKKGTDGDDIEEDSEVSEENRNYSQNIENATDDSDLYNNYSENQPPFYQNETVRFDNKTSYEDPASLVEAGASFLKTTDDKKINSTDEEMNQFNQADDNIKDIHKFPVDFEGNGTMFRKKNKADFEGVKENEPLSKSGVLESALRELNNNSYINQTDFSISKSKMAASNTTANVSSEISSGNSARSNHKLQNNYRQLSETDYLLGKLTKSKW